MKRKLFLGLCLAAGLLTACHKKPTEILVDRIEFDPSQYGMFVDDRQDVTVKCYPANAGNLDQLTISISNPEVANFKDGKLTALAPGTCKLIARCGTVSAQAPITVYSGYFTKGGKKYGVDSASGYLITMGESTPQEMEMTLTYNEAGGDTQNFWFFIKCSNLGKTINFMENMDESLVSVQKNNNEDGYCVPYAQEDGTPVVKLADWGDTDATLAKGTLRVDDLGSSRYKVSADFVLSNEYTFSAEWEGVAIMQRE